MEIVKAFVMGIVRAAPFEKPEARMGWYLILATIPAGILGLLIKDKVEAAFNSPQATAAFLFITAILLVIAELVGRRKRPIETLNWVDALVMGIFQALSIFPGVSRSGSTITGGMMRNLERTAAARFSFLMSIPVMLAAGLVSALDLRDIPGLVGFLPVIAAGFVAAAIVGFLSIRWLLGYLGKRSLLVFSIYCVILGALVLIVSYVRA